MPRQDVPYGGAICRLKERIAEIWDKLDQKLHSINGVEGDGAGNVDIVSGNAAVVINNDQIGHRIEVSIDSSKLPAAAVSSVNGETGAVRLDAAHIPSNGSLTVQTDIDWCRQRINECFDSIATEEDDRLNADAALQTNINTVSSSIPEMSMTPDPYKGVERDAQGRAFAADPDSGATDKTLVTANWVSQTGDGAANNLLHRSGNETSTGFKFGNFSVKQGNVSIPQPDTDGKYRRIFRIKNVGINTAIDMRIYVNSNINYGCMLDVFALIGSAVWGNKTGLSFGGYTFNGVFFGYDGTNIDIWTLDESYRPKSIKINNVLSYGSTIQPDIDFDGSTIADNYTEYASYTVTGGII